MFSFSSMIRCEFLAHWAQRTEHCAVPEEGCEGKIIVTPGGNQEDDDKWVSCNQLKVDSDVCVISEHYTLQESEARCSVGSSFQNRWLDDHAGLKSVWRRENRVCRSRFSLLAQRCHTMNVCERVCKCPPSHLDDSLHGCVERRQEAEFFFHSWSFRSCLSVDEHSGYNRKEIWHFCWH